jgi:putative ABC transport system permease protein
VEPDPEYVIKKYLRMNKNEIHPPRWAEKFLSWYCKPSLLEDLQGDLNEYFQRNLKAKGSTRAKLIYIIDVFKFLRLYTIRKPEFINVLINWIMLGSYIKTSGRSIMRNKLFSAINIVGLSVSMAVGLLMIGIISDISSYDKFHEKHDRIYRITSVYQWLENKDSQGNASNSMMVGKAMQENFPEVERVAVLHTGYSGDFQVGETTVTLNGLWSNESVFDVFSFKLLQGNTATVLKQPFSVVLTETSARKLFGDGNAVGKTITLNKDRQYTVTGIMKDVPTFSHMKFDVLGSLSTREILQVDDHEWKWDNVWSTYVYVLMQKDADMEAFQQKLTAYARQNDNLIPNVKVYLGFQPLTDILIGEDLNNQLGATFGKITFWIFLAITTIILLSAAFNYTNLSIARALRRSREVGVRKIIGAVKGHIIGQFAVESVIISLLALVFAFGLFVLLKPHLLSLQSDLHELLVLDVSPALIGYFIAFAIIIGLLAGLFPALFFSKINAVKVLKDVSSVQVFRKITMRKMLIVLQYSISIIFITSMLIMHKQYKHFLAFNFGFTIDNIVNISLQGNKADPIIAELRTLPEVQNVSMSRLITSTGNYWGVYMKTDKDLADSTMVWHNLVDENYLPLHDFALLAGKNFTAKPDSAKETEVIVNQQILKRFNIASQIPSDAVGETVKLNNNNVTIIGVVKDFTYGKADNNNSNEVVFRYGRKDAEYINVKFATNDWPATREKIEAIWKKHDAIHPMHAKLYKDQINEGFDGLRASVKLATFMAGMAICISSLGLLGMVVFTTETRLREVSIRKVLGASEGKLIFLLGRGFVVLLAIATFISLPLTYLFFEKVMLVKLSNHTSIEAFEMFAGVIGILILAAVLIGSQTFKIARTNPADVLKNE